MLAGLGGAAILWGLVLTDTGGSALAVLKQSIGSVENGFSLGGRASDATKLVGLGSPSPSKMLEAYVKNVVVPTREKTTPSMLYGKRTYGEDPVLALPTVKLPVSRLGEWLRRIGIPAVEVNRMVISLLSKGVE